MTGTPPATCAATRPIPQAEPRVVLRLSVGDRTFRFTRSPAWDRPKRRGDGTTRVQAHVVVEEHRDGEWIALTNRLDEAGQLVTGLLGMTCTQFTQVAMLPQGRFQAFLRASSAERHAVLQRLFRTRRFEDVERWLVERRVELRRRSQTCHDRCAGVVNRFQEAAGVGVPEEWDLHDLEPVAVDGSLTAWAEGLSEHAATDGRALPGRLRRRLTARGSTGPRATGAGSGRGAGRGERARARWPPRRDRGRRGGPVASLEAHRRAAPCSPRACVRERRAAAAEAGPQRRARRPRRPALDQRRRGDGGAGRGRGPGRRGTCRRRSWLPREQELHDERARVDRPDGAGRRLEPPDRCCEEERAAHDRGATGADCPRPAGRVPAARPAGRRRDRGGRASQRPSRWSELTRRLDDARSCSRPRPSSPRTSARPTSTSGSAASPAWPPSSPAGSRSAAPARSAAASSTRRPPSTRATSAAPTRRRPARATSPPTSSARPRQELVTTLESQLAGARVAQPGPDVAHWQRAR